MGKSSRFGDVGGRRQGKNSLKNSNHEYGNGANAKIRFKRLKARVGSQYQTRVAKAVPASAAEQNRPSPLLMSTEYPFVAQDIVNQYRLERSETDNVEPNSTWIPKEEDGCGSASLDHDHCRGYESEVKKSNRGGVCVHKRAHGDEIQGYLTCCHKYLTGQRRKKEPEGPDETWKQSVVQMYGAARQQRRRKKRKLFDQHNNDYPWGRPHTNEDEDKDSLSNNNGSNHHLRENESSMLAYLQTRHNGDVASSNRSLRVALTGGRAVKARKIHSEDLHNTRFKRGSAKSSASWRVRFQRSFPSIQGDFRSDPGLNKYPHDDNRDAEGSNDPNRASVVHPVDDDTRSVWRNVLSCAQAMERVLKGHTSKETTTSTRRPFLSEALRLVRNACALPTPEEAFGSRHMVVEQISVSLHTVLDEIAKARDAEARINDMLFDQKQEGIETDALRRTLDETNKNVALRLDDEDNLRLQLEAAGQWQKQVDALHRIDQHQQATAQHSDDDDNHALSNSLGGAETLMQASSTYAIQSRGMVQLQRRIDKAYQLRDRIETWKNKRGKGVMESPRIVSALVREAKKIDLPSKEIWELLRLHRVMEEWIDRANIAIRSRISLNEVRSLIERAAEMDVDLADYTDKLKVRARTASEWESMLEQEVPCQHTEDGGIDYLAWLSLMRAALHEEKKGRPSRLHELSSEGTRIPVEIESLKLLQLEIDAKSWSSKAMKWIGTEDCKKGKVEELRDHLFKGGRIREKAFFEEKGNWVLDGEAELKVVVDAADKWSAQYQQYLDWDNRRATGRCCMSIETLRRIVDEGSAIHANVGGSITKMAKVLAQAQTWQSKHATLLDRCGVSNGTGQPTGAVSLQEITTAVADAANEVAIDLEEALTLKALGDKTQNWLDRTLLAAPKRTKRHGKGNNIRYTVGDLADLIAEAKTLPIRVDEDVQRLQRQLKSVGTWCMKARSDLAAIARGFQSLRESISVVHGRPDDFYGLNDEAEQSEAIPIAATEGAKEEVPPVAQVGGTSEVSANDEASPSPGDGSSVVADSELDSGKVSVLRLVSSLLSESRQNGVLTTEEEAATALDKVAKWCMKSVKYVSSPRELFERRAFKPFDKFLQAGRGLRDEISASVPEEVRSGELSDIVLQSWNGLLEDQFCRLEKLKSHRDEFVAWYQEAQAFVQANECRLTIDAICDLTKKSRRYPATADMVQKVRNKAQKAEKWQRVAAHTLSTGTKISMEEAKAMYDEGHALHLVCDELKMLKAGISAARAWQNRIKRSKADQEGSSQSLVDDLIEKHNKLIIAMPKELAKLKQATKGYCICRRPFEGFMIGCDGCNEWFHGSCIGVSEAQAERVEKFLCVRCCVVRVFKASSSSIASIIRKWTSKRCLKKARQVESQKHQRKVRKERKDIEKLQMKIRRANERLNQLREEQTEKAMPADQAPKQDAVAVAVAADNKEIAKEPSEKLPVEVPKKEVFEQSSSVEKEGQAIKEGNAQTAEVSQPNPKAVQTPKNEFSSLGQQEVQAIVDRTYSAIKECEDRLRLLADKGAERLSTELEEDRLHSQLKSWCIRVRARVLVPTTKASADESVPSADGSMSAPMIKLFRDAEMLGIAKLPDVHNVANHFKAIGWSCLASKVLMKRPSAKAMQDLLTRCSSIDLPEEKATRMMKAMAQKTNQWQSKVRKVLSPKPGEKRPFNLALVNQLKRSAIELPLHPPELFLLTNTTEDKGTRHCVCGGPNDGSFMMSCDKCSGWFHGRCVNIDRSVVDTLEHWVCPNCSGSSSETSPAGFNAVEWEGDSDGEESETNNDDQSGNVPTPIKMWPPFGLLGSTESIEVLGEECVSMGDEVGDHESPKADSNPPVPPRSSIPIGEKINFAPYTSALLPPPKTVLGSNLVTVVSPEVNVAVRQGKDETTFRAHDGGKAIVQPTPATSDTATADAADSKKDVVNPGALAFQPVVVSCVLSSNCQNPGILGTTVGNGEVSETDSSAHLKPSLITKDAVAPTPKSNAAGVVGC